MPRQSYEGYQRKAIEPILGDPEEVGSVFRHNAILQNLSRQNSLVDRWSCAFAIRRIVSRIIAGIICIQKVPPGVCAIPGALLCVPGNRKTESKNSIFLSVREMWV